jgi:hypothetical protein
MSSPKDRIPVPGSERAPLPGAPAVDAANPDESIQVTVLLRPRVSKDSSNIELPSNCWSPGCHKNAST